MKKAFVALSALKNVEVLSREAQRKIGGGICYSQDGSGGIIGYNAASGNAEAAQRFASANGVHWCCSSCATASWMQPFIG